MKRACSSLVSTGPSKKSRWESSASSSSSESVNIRASIQTLPPELVTLVFSYLNPRDIHSNVAQVCSEWNMLHLDPSVYRVFEFKTLEEDLDSKLKYLRLAPWLMSLTLENQVDSTTILETVSACNHRLHHLTLKSCRGSPIRENITAVTLKKVIRKCPQLKELKFKKCKGLTKLFYKQVGSRLPQLKVVHFIDTPHFGGEGVLSLAKNCLGLEELKATHKFQFYDEGQSDNDDIKVLCEKLGGSLKRLHLNAYKWTAKSFSAVAQCSKLEELTLRCAVKISDDDIIKLGSLQQLRHLDLSLCLHVTEATWVNMFSGASLKNLRVLKLTICSINNVVLTAIGTHLKQLEKLCLSGFGLFGPNWMGVEAIIRGCPKLSHIELVFMNLSVKEVFLLVPIYLPHLKKLITSEPLREVQDVIQSHMPGLVIQGMDPRWTNYYVSVIDSPDFEFREMFW